LAAREDVELRVYYLEGACPDSPWPKDPLRPFEQIMSGFWLPFRGARWHFNWPLPDCSEADFVVLSSFCSSAGQWLLRRRPQRQHWLYWGERLRPQGNCWREFVQRTLVAPLEHITAIVGVGRDAEMDYARRFPAARHFCLPYHCDLSAFLLLPRRGDSSGPVTFLFCGQMIRRKGVDLLLTAFDRLLRKGLDARLLLVGREADLPSFLASVSSAARSRISYVGFVTPGRLPEYFSRADAFVLPSRHDGWGVVINQALAAGLPIITSDAVGAGLDLVENDVNGLHFAAGNIEDLQSCMERLAASPAQARLWGQASRRSALSIVPERGAAKWAHIFQELSEMSL
jgi:glycosyltransferase involved in cell wall biosynthesis